MKRNPRQPTVCTCRYTKAIDSWALGCIFGQMLQRTMPTIAESTQLSTMLLAGKALFMGSSSLHQMDLIIQVWYRTNGLIDFGDCDHLIACRHVMHSDAHMQTQ